MKKIIHIRHLLTAAVSFCYDTEQSPFSAFLEDAVIIRTRTSESKAIRDILLISYYVIQGCELPVYH
jgi:hypothetical protein